MKNIRNYILAGLTCIASTTLVLIALFAPTELWAPWFMLGMGLVAGFYVGTFLQWICTASEADRNHQNLSALKKLLAKATTENNWLKNRIRELENALLLSSKSTLQWVATINEMASAPEFVADTDIAKANADLVSDENAELNTSGDNTATDDAE